MNAFRLSAAGGALALHGLVLTGVLSLTLAPPTTREIEPVQVRLLTPPEPLPTAPTPRPAESVPRAAETQAKVAVPPPEPVRQPPAPRKQARPRPAPPKPAPPVAQPAPPPDRASETATHAITPAPTIAASEPVQGPAQATGEPPPPAAATALASARSGPGDAAAQAEAPVRSAPRIDASWSGNTPPPYPGLARRMGDQGEVRLDVRVGVDGKVTAIRLKQSSGSALLDRTAIDTVRKWRFKPATVDGQPVAEWYHDWRWVFRLEG